MPSRTPVLGFRSLSEASARLREQGMTLQQIAARLSQATGRTITAKQVSDLEGSWWRACALTKLRLPLTLDRRFSLAHHIGEVFEEGEDYKGPVLQIEIKDQAELDAVRKALRAAPFASFTDDI